MKKILVLLTLLCAGQLYSMEAPEYGHYKGLGGLSPEIQIIIIQALHNYDKPIDVINAIKATSLVDKELNEIVNDMYGNQKGFTKLMHILADKFGFMTADIAAAFKTPAAKTYLNLGFELSDLAAYDISTDKLVEAIKNGADINFSSRSKSTPLQQAITNLKIEAVKLLLNAGANPEHALLSAKCMLTFYQPGEDAEKAKAIEEILEEAMKKHPPSH